MPDFIYWLPHHFFTPSHHLDRRLLRFSCNVTNMQACKILLLLAAALGGFEVYAQNETLSIDAVSAQVSDFLQLIQNGSLSAAAGDVAQRSLPSGCSLAVSTDLTLSLFLRANIPRSVVSSISSPQGKWPTLAAQLLPRSKLDIGRNSKHQFLPRAASLQHRHWRSRLPFSRCKLSSVNSQSRVEAMLPSSALQTLMDQPPTEV